MKIFFGSSISTEMKFLISQDIEISNDLVIEKFSDGEILPKFLKSVRNEDIFLIQSLTNSNLIIETLLTMDAAKRAGCNSISLVAPYLSYSRQDKTDHLRSSIGAKMMADILESVGMATLITIDLHASSIQGFYNDPVIHLNGSKIFIEYIKDHRIEDLTIVAPDQGAVKRASDFCKAFPEATFAMINKKRIKPNEVHSMELVGDVKGRNVVIVDDMVDTGKTLSKAVNIILENGALSVRAVATHGVLSGEGKKIINDSKLLELLVSDTISNKPDGKIKVISCAGLITKSIIAITNKKSIHEFNNV